MKALFTVQEKIPSIFGSYCTVWEQGCQQPVPAARKSGTEWEM
jgi:hypothetical protein